jgi:hypothetical protein
MALEFTTFLQFFPEALGVIDQASYETQSQVIELELACWDGLICLPKDCTDLNLAKVKAQATALYYLHNRVLQTPSFGQFTVEDDVEKIESLDDKITFRDYKFSSAYDLKRSQYGVRLLAMLDKYSCKRIREEQYAADTLVHTFSGIGESFSSGCDDCCDEDDYTFGVIW